MSACGSVLRASTTGTMCIIARRDSATTLPLSIFSARSHKLNAAANSAGPTELYMPAWQRKAKSSASRLPGPRARHASSIDGNQLYLHGARKARNDLILHSQEVAAIGVELIGPQMRAGLRVDELGIYPHLVAAVLFASLQHIAHVQVSTDLLYVPGLPLYVKGCCA